MTLNKPQFKISAILGFIPVLLTGCNSEHHNEHGSEAEHHDHQDEIVMSPSDAARFGVQAEAIDKSPFSEVLKTVGEIMPAASESSVVSAPTAGIVRLAAGVELGKTVKAGEAIAVISPKNISGGDINAASKANLDAAKRELDRLEPLLKDGIVTKKDYNEAKRAYEEAKSSFSPVAATGRATAPMSGTISELAVNDGAYVEAGQPIAVIGRNARLTLRALLPAADVDFLPRITSANFKSSKSDIAISLSDRKGALLSATTSGSGATPGYIPVYFSFDSNGDVIPGMPVEIYLVGSQRIDALTVPVEAISEQQGETFVYIKIEDHAYRKQNVKLGRSDGKRIEILKGVEAGDSVVTIGSTFIRLAETSTVVPEGHSHSH